ncbi:MAG: hypothetical protein WDA37_02510 [Dysgonamonadaceae bacterium]
MIQKKLKTREDKKMPYINEYADKTSHIDIVRNPDIINFLDNCKYMVEPSESEATLLSNKFIAIPAYDTYLPNNIIAIDGSNYEASIRKDIPCTRIGYVKIGNLLIKRDSYKNLRSGSCFLDPFKVAMIKKNNTATTFSLPSSNMLYKDQKTVRESFRLVLDEMLYDFRTDPLDSKTSLRSTLFLLASYRTGDMATNSRDKLFLHACPSCKSEKVEVFDIADAQFCPHCHERVYPSDSLRIWEEVSDAISNQSALTRFMNVIEHIFAIHYIRIIKDYSPESFVEVLSNLCIFIDGPLAIFGNSAWLHSCIMKYLHEINKQMKGHGKSNVMILGLQKSGFIYDYFQLVKDKIPNNTIYCLEDDVRYKYININKKPSSSTFGSETYYGQDFLYKTASGRVFVFNIPYPFPDKQNKDVFSIEKSRIENYTNIGAYTRLINEFECDLYENAVVPIALAHKYTAISLEPGSRVLDLLSKSKI